VTDDVNGPEPDDDSAEWLSRLGGEARSTAYREKPHPANVIRSIVVAEQDIVSGTITEEQLLRAEQRLLSRLSPQTSRSGPVRPLPARRPDGGGSQPGRARFAIAAGLLLIPLAAWFLATRPESPPPGSDVLMAYGDVETPRGPASGEQEIVVSDPDGSARDVARRLEMIHVPYELRRVAGRPGARLLIVQVYDVASRSDLERELSLLGPIRLDGPVLRLWLVPPQ
jgi:hypothetical protein